MFNPITGGTTMPQYNPESTTVFQHAPRQAGWASYRCLRCNTIHNNEQGIYTADLEGTMQSTLAGGGSLPLYTMHDCADGGVGVCQLIGGVYKEAPTVPHNPRDFKLAVAPEVVARVAEIVPTEVVEARFGADEGTDTPQEVEVPTEAVEPPQPTTSEVPPPRVKRDHKRRA
jgi:hypothetical protein